MNTIDFADPAHIPSHNSKDNSNPIETEDEKLQEQQNSVALVIRIEICKAEWDFVIDNSDHTKLIEVR